MKQKMEQKKAVTKDVKKPPPVKKSPNGIGKGRGGKSSAGSGRGKGFGGGRPKIDPNRARQVSPVGASRVVRERLRHHNRRTKRAQVDGACENQVEGACENQVDETPSKSFETPPKGDPEIAPDDPDDFQDVGDDVQKQVDQPRSHRKKTLTCKAKKSSGKRSNRKKEGVKMGRPRKEIVEPK